VAAMLAQQLIDGHVRPQGMTCVPVPATASRRARTTHVITRQMVVVVTSRAVFIRTSLAIGGYVSTSAAASARRSRGPAPARPRGAVRVRRRVSRHRSPKSRKTLLGPFTRDQDCFQPTPGRGDKMSDVSQGPGWWLASDSKWYPPETAPPLPPPPPPTTNASDATPPQQSPADTSTSQGMNEEDTSSTVPGEIAPPPSTIVPGGIAPPPPPSTAPAGVPPPPSSTGKPLTRRPVFWGIVAAAAVVLLIGIVVGATSGNNNKNKGLASTATTSSGSTGSTGNSGSNSGSTGNSGATATTSPPTTTPTQPVQLPIGTAGSLTKNGAPFYDVTATQFVDPAQPSNQYVTPQNAGDIFVAVAFTIKSTGTLPISDDIYLDTKIYDSAGQGFSSAFEDTSSGPSFPSGNIDVAPGGTASGWVMFEVPGSVSLTTVNFTPGAGYAIQAAQMWTLGG
jgi:hypothetical protein